MGAHLIRSHDVFAPNSSLRVPLTPSGCGMCPETGAATVDICVNEEQCGLEERRRAMSWAQRLKHVFNIDAFGKHDTLEKAHYRPVARAPPDAA
ncbi:MAG: hypothetical protein JNN30_07105 [Rhodanobacteraceae bacterium]|nr:hypothetical protein [Rhodanobacteraceae bacterium]